MNSKGNEGKHCLIDTEMCKLDWIMMVRKKFLRCLRSDGVVFLEKTASGSGSGDGTGASHSSIEKRESG